MTNQPFLQEVENDSGLNNLKSTQDWLKENKIFIELKLEEHGAIIFKDLPVKTAEDFDQFVSSFNYDTFIYEESLSNAVRLNKTNKVFTLGHHNKNFKKNYRKIYNNDMKIKVYEVYKRDFVVFNYNFSNNNA